ncbi:hypothetical protein Peur_030502 [Populus x canadensis]
MSRPKMGLGVGLFLFGSKGVWVWVLLCPDRKGFGIGLKSGPKRFGVSSRTQNEFECGSFLVQTERGLGLGPSVSGSKGVWDGFEVRIQGVGVLLCLDLKECGMGSESGPKGFEFGVSVRTQNGFWCGSGQHQGMTIQALRIHSLGRNPSSPTTLELLWLGMATLVPGVYA